MKMQFLWHAFPLYVDKIYNLEDLKDFDLLHRIHLHDKGQALCSHLLKEITQIWYSLISIPYPTSLNYEPVDLHAFCTILGSWRMKHSLEELPQSCFKPSPWQPLASHWCLKKLFHLCDRVKCIQWPFIIPMCDRHLLERRSQCILLN